jgi:hypothetical protein
MLPIYVLEDKDRDLHSYMKESEILSAKVKTKTAIPYGRYPIRMVYSPKFDCLMPEIYNVKGFSKTYLHNGSYIEHTDGCPLVGYEWRIRQPENDYMVTKSKDCFKELKPIISIAINAGKEVWIDIVK